MLPLSCKQDVAIVLFEEVSRGRGADRRRGKPVAKLVQYSRQNARVCRTPLAARRAGMELRGCGLERMCGMRARR